MSGPTPKAERLNALIVDPDGESKNRVRHALSEFGEFGNVESTSSLEESARRFGFGESFDVIFLSRRFEPEEVNAFVKKVRNTKGGEGCTFILLIPQQDETVSSIALKLVSGVDGFLLQPYSSEQLLDIVALSFRVKGERSDLKARVGLTLIVSDVVEQLNLVAFLQANGFDASLSLRRLKDLGRSLKELAPEYQEVYFDIFERLFMEAPFPKHLHSAPEKYGGLSDRVRKRMEKKILVELEDLKLKKKREQEESAGISVEEAIRIIKKES